VRALRLPWLSQPDFDACCGPATSIRARRRLARARLVGRRAFRLAGLPAARRRACGQGRGHAREMAAPAGVAALWRAWNASAPRREAGRAAGARTLARRGPGLAPAAARPDDLTTRCSPTPSGKPALPARIAGFARNALTRWRHGRSPAGTGPTPHGYSHETRSGNSRRQRHHAGQGPMVVLKTEYSRGGAVPPRCA